LAAAGAPPLSSRGIVFRVWVRCEDGSSGEREPIEVGWGHRRIRVREIVDRWFGAGCRYFKLIADDGGLYILRHDQMADAWELTFFQRAAHANTGP